ncbi:carbon monoxide dehydrogenase accessory protein CooC [Treponema primitia ZAS-2]|uniref:Carbon monoxide dehydrogenase accessory protein CooC n=1 Tax=Treponema primitia (strain ATCC BAA-887 / DSM 12427 / ZAS-2) TaxID=545694 RepID=F5YMN7_TREPZ|nr:AAA family ATPase [Treponema primitia]AEF83878.1 carbon monoxide dehydrogenase accessory protein CooC [Treponema primitia ZAS-2]
MKIAITGKGGVGKTTLAAVLARLYAAENRTVLAVDVDPDANLGLALGFTEEEVAAITPISKMSDLIAERTGSNKDTFGKFFKINPKVDDIPELFAREKNGVKFLVMGTVETGGGGCVCPEHVMVKRVISHLVVARDEVVIMDMEAGLEHLGRGTAGMVDRFIVVIEPGERSIQTYHKVKSLAADLGVMAVSVVASKVRSKDDEEYLKARIPAEDLFGFISYNEEIIDADRRGVSPYDTSGKAKAEIMKIKERIDAAK